MRQSLVFRQQTPDTGDTVNAWGILYLDDYL